MWLAENPPANAGDSRDSSLIPGLGRSPGGGHGNPLQYSCLKNLVDEEPEGATVHGGHRESDTTEQLTLSLFTLYLPLATLREP